MSVTGTVHGAQEDRASSTWKASEASDFLLFDRLRPGPRIDICRCASFCCFRPLSDSVFYNFPVLRRPRLNRLTLLWLSAVLLLAGSAPAQMDDASTRQLAHDIFKQLIEI